MILGRNFFLSENLRQFFCPIHKVLENHDLGKTSLPPKFFWAGTPMVVRAEPRRQLSPKSQNFGQNQNFLNCEKNYFGKMKNFRAATRNYFDKINDFMRQN